MKATYLTCCVNSTARLIDNMVGIAKEITCKTFLRRADIDVESFGYVRRGKGLKLQNDWYVRFYKSRYGGKLCYYMVHSATEYIYTI